MQTSKRLYENAQWAVTTYGIEFTRRPLGLSH